jgi:hypothetical protein
MTRAFAVLPLLIATNAVADRVVVVGRVDDGPWTDAPTLARADQRAQLSLVVMRGRQTFAPDGVTKVRIDGRAIVPSPLVGATLHWSTVEPHPFRATPATNGATSQFYSNVSTDPKTFGTWLGYDHIDYFERALETDRAIIPATVDTGDDMPLPGIGTIRYKVEAELADGTRLASPGAEAVDTAGITAAVHRVSVRLGDDFLGWLTAYLQVPEVFGSAGRGRWHQTDRFTGADCADVLVGALRRTGRDVEYTSVAGLPAYTTKIAGPVALDEHGMPARSIEGVKRGDLIRIDYGGELAHHTPRAFDHVAALWEDRSDPDGPFHGGPDGQLDGWDLVIHMGHPHLMIEPLSSQAPATIDVLRWKR